MDNREENIDLIEGYIDKKLSPEEMLKVEDRMKKDPAFRQEVEKHREIAAFLGEKDVMGLRQQLKVAQEQYSKKPVQPDHKVATGNGLKIAAAVVVLIGLATAFYLLYNPVEKDVFATYFEPYPVYNQVRASDSEISDLDKGLEAYKKGEFAKALMHFEELPDKKSNMMIQFYMGVAQLAQEQEGRAVQSLERVVSDGDNFFVEPAEWYLALAYYKTGEIEESKWILSKISDSHLFSKEAKLMLQRLEQMH